MKEYMNGIHSLQEFNDVIDSNKTSVFVFSASWCPDCRFIEPFMKEIVEQFHDFDFYYVDRDECMDICQQFMIMGIPSFLVFKESKEIGRFVSKARKTQQEISIFLSGLKK